MLYDEALAFLVQLDQPFLLLFLCLLLGCHVGRRGFTTLQKGANLFSTCGSISCSSNCNFSLKFQSEKLFPSKRLILNLSSSIIHRTLWINITNTCMMASHKTVFTLVEYQLFLHYIKHSGPITCCYRAIIQPHISI
jgi:hypothetical protein